MHFNFQAVLDAGPYLLKGLALTLELTAVAFVGGLTLGTLIAVIRQMQTPVLAKVLGAYVTLLRSIPVILLLFWFFFLVPLVLGRLSGAHSIPIGPRWTAFIAFVLVEAAYYAEIVRAGLRSVDKGQFQAAAALGLSTFDTYTAVIIPQVLRATSPVIVSQTIVLFQDTSLVYVISLTDFLGAASQIAQRDGTLVEMYTTVAAVYLLLCSLGSELAEHLKAARHSHHKGQARPRPGWMKALAFARQQG